jgi:hypothetical protein
MVLPRQAAVLKNDALVSALCGEVGVAGAVLLEELVGVHVVEGNAHCKHRVGEEHVPGDQRRRSLIDWVGTQESEHTANYLNATKGLLGLASE